LKTHRNHNSNLRNLSAVMAVAVGLVLGCGPGQPASAQPTPTALAPAPQAERPAAAADNKPPSPAPAIEAASPSPQAVTSPSPRPAAAPPAEPEPAWPSINLELITNSLSQPVHVTHAGDGSGRLFVVGKGGRITIVREGGPLSAPFLDITPIVRSRDLEQGLLGLAFHPSYASNGLFYVNYTDTEGDTVVARYRVSPDNPDIADPGSGSTLLGIEQPAANHNGGHLTFGPDGHLYIGMGDGGRAGDPWGNAQNTGVLLGKMLRIDVNGGPPYGIPPDNPFIRDSAARPEIWAYGLRNPWRYSFDRATGDLYIADVGQNRWEWLHHQPGGAGGGQNYGWNRMEGGHCFPPGSSCDPSPFVSPIAEYPSSQGCSIIGGFVYRGPNFPQLDGFYFFGDYCSGRLWAARQHAPDDWRQQELLKSPLRISSFGEDEAGDVYLTSLSDNGLYRLVAAP
jgi:glucose/arabinose dehydrogenase